MVENPFVFQGEMSALFGKEDGSAAECADAIPVSGVSPKTVDGANPISGHGHISSGRQRLRARNCDGGHRDCRFSTARSTAPFAFISVHKVHAIAM